MYIKVNISLSLYLSLSLSLLLSDQAVKTVSQEATKLSLAFSKPPVPSQEVRTALLLLVVVVLVV